MARKCIRLFSVFFAFVILLEYSLPVNAVTRDVLDMYGDVPFIQSSGAVEYFNKAAFIGDSIMVGYRNCCENSEEAAFSGTEFLAAVGYGFTNGMKSVTDYSKHPLYQGKKQYAWDSLAQMDVDRVFIMLGMNDLRSSLPDKAFENYVLYIDKIQEVCPDIQINLISVTYIYESGQESQFNNDNVHAFNELVRTYADDNGYGYVNLADALADENGNMASEYSSDKYVHFNKSGYDVMNDVIIDFAKNQIL